MSVALDVDNVNPTSFFNKYLDQSNLNNAYVSGLKEELGWTGNQYTYATSLYTAAYAIMQIPSTLVVQKVRPSLWLAFCEIAWATFTFAQAGVRKTNTMYALRFMVGITESAFFPVGVYLLGSWYTPAELAKRTAIFHFTAPAGTAFAGYMQAAVYKNLNEAGGMEGWRWLYSEKRWFLTEDELVLARNRMARVKRVQSDGVFQIAALKRIFSNWPIYVLPLTYIFYGLSCAGSGYFSIYLKSTHKYSVEMINILPTFVSIIQAVTTLAWGFLSDYTGSRFWFTFAVWPYSIHLKQFAFMTLGVQLMTAVIYSWFMEICSSDPLERALVIGMANGLQYVMSAWIPLLIFKQTDSPSFRKGFPTDFAFVLISLVLLIIIKVFHARDLRGKVEAREDYDIERCPSSEDGKVKLETGYPVTEVRTPGA
ncbi:hypothetical protein IAR55_006368 [Kwoniella newhampshirensis]|uniref:Major facilitator superfamily (MFS) profile domain-containing protein n=1 Tax=Kwoniella newhampshirensis TaxID=1651941 RepID=A0AAW0YWV8_9TREE